jgi:hypothetical protein
MAQDQRRVMDCRATGLYNASFPGNAGSSRRHDGLRDRIYREAIRDPRFRDFEISGSWEGALPQRSRGARRKQRKEPTTRHKGNWRVPCSCLRVETPVVAHSCFALPRSSALCGCINVPGRQADRPQERTESVEIVSWVRDVPPHMRSEAVSIPLPRVACACPLPPLSGQPNAVDLPPRLLGPGQPECIRSQVNPRSCLVGLI